MKVLFIESLFSKISFEAEVDALPRSGDYIEIDTQVFIVDKVVFRLGAKKEIAVLMQYK